MVEAHRADGPSVRVEHVVGSDRLELSEGVLR